MALAAAGCTLIGLPNFEKMRVAHNAYCDNPDFVRFARRADGGTAITLRDIALGPLDIEDIFGIKATHCSSRPDCLQQTWTMRREDDSLGVDPFTVTARFEKTPETTYLREVNFPPRLAALVREELLGAYLEASCDFDIRVFDMAVALNLEAIDPAWLPPRGDVLGVVGPPDAGDGPHDTYRFCIEPCLDGDGAFALKRRVTTDLTWAGEAFQRSVTRQYLFEVDADFAKREAVMTVTGF